jgi:hypothetical protein
MVASRLGKQLVRPGRERDEQAPPAVELTAEYIRALLRSLVLGAIRLARRKGAMLGVATDAEAIC